MPLPENSTLILSPPGLASGDSKATKHAMLVRMSAECFEALESELMETDRKLDVQFGNKPGFCIGNAFFPFNATEETPHDLYVRCPSATKPNPPLRPHASIVGRITVTRELGEKEVAAVRDRTIEAEKQRTERKAIYLENPPELGKPSKTKKSSAARRPAASSTSKAFPQSTPIHPPPPKPSPATSSSRPRTSTGTNSRDTVSSSKASLHNTSTSQAAVQTPDFTSTRARLIHCLALKPRTTKAIAAMCVGKDPTEELKVELMGLVSTLAELAPPLHNNDSDPQKRYQLTLEGWREVRPYEWPNLRDEDRVNLCRSAQRAFKELRIPSSDPLWQHVRIRSGDGSASGSSNHATAATRPAGSEKNGLVMTKSKAKAKTTEGTRKKVSDIMVPAKDESMKGKARELDDGAASTPTSATRPPARRQPGSGYKVKQSETPPISDPRAHSPLPPIPRKGPVDARESKRDRPQVSGSAKPMPPIAPPVDSRTSSSTAAIKKKPKETAQASSSQRADSERREARPREREHERDQPKEEKPRAKVPASPVPHSLPSFTRKRRQDGNDSEYSERETPLSASASKRRKIEEQSSSEKARVRDLSLPKKPGSPLGPPGMNIKKEASPLLSSAFSPPRATPARSSLPPRPLTADKPIPSSSSSTSAHSGKSAHTARSSESVKPRRRSPIYTSSESESQASVPPVRRPPPKTHSPAPEPPAKAYPPVTHTPRFKPRSLPVDSAGLRKYYRGCYRIYRELYDQYEARKVRIERMLARNARGEAGTGTGTGTDDEMDIDELSPEVVSGFMEEFQAVDSELRKVRKAFERLGGKADALGDLVDAC